MVTGLRLGLGGQLWYIGLQPLLHMVTGLRLGLGGQLCYIRLQPLLRMVTGLRLGLGGQLCVGVGGRARLVRVSNGMRARARVGGMGLGL
eukprot:scaffold58454_cov47-Phaeocystis_antarctica.AAC.1